MCDPLGRPIRPDASALTPRITTFAVKLPFRKLQPVSSPPPRRSMCFLAGLLPLNWLGGPAFAYNVLTLITFALSFAGMRRLASGFLGALAPTVTALLYTFWGFHWLRIIGHMNVLIAVAVLPWMLWSLERFVDGGRRANWWLILTGVLWALAATSSWYFLPMGAVLLVCWVTGRFLGGAIPDRRAASRILLIPTGIGLLLSTPFLLDFVHQSAAAKTPRYRRRAAGSRRSSVRLPTAVRHHSSPLAAYEVVTRPGAVTLRLAAAPNLDGTQAQGLQCRTHGAPADQNSAAHQRPQHT